MAWCSKCMSYNCDCKENDFFEKRCVWCGGDHDSWSCPEKARRDDQWRRVRDPHNPQWG